MKYLIPIVFIKGVLILLLILQGSIGLSPDEAQYWTWSQDLAPGYYSKPPGIAYQIALGTALFGNNEFGVRFGAWLISLITPFLIYYLADLTLKSKQIALWAALIWTLAPMGFLGSFLAITDGGMILFWILALIVYTKRGLGPLVGIMIALGALFKWPIYLFWLFVVADQYKNHRLLLNPELFYAVLISLLGLIPSILWNYDHAFATFRHVGATLQGGSGAQPAKSNFFEFFGSQLGLFSPIFFGLFLYAYKFKDKALHFLKLTALPLILIGLTGSLFMKIQGNWAILAYPSASILAAFSGIVLTKNRNWLYAGLAVSLLMVAALYLFVPFKHNEGWNQLSPLLKQAGYDKNKDFLVADKYQNSSILSFYAPGQKRAYFLNLRGDRQNQFSFWPALKDEQMHKDGYFVTVQSTKDKEEIPNLKPYFESVVKVGTYHLTDKKTATIYRVINYNGLEPNDSHKF